MKQPKVLILVDMNPEEADEYGKPSIEVVGDTIKGNEVAEDFVAGDRSYRYIIESTIAAHTDPPRCSSCNEKAVVEKDIGTARRRLWQLCADHEDAFLNSPVTQDYRKEGLI